MEDRARAGRKGQARVLHCVHTDSTGPRITQDPTLLMGKRLSPRSRDGPVAGEAVKSFNS